MSGDWTNKRLGEVLSLEYGEALAAVARSGQGFPVFGSNGCVGHHQQYLVPGPGIIVGRKGSVGDVTWSSGPFWVIDTAYYVKEKCAFDWRWCYWLLESLNLKKLDSSTGVPGLNREDVYRQVVTTPCPTEQTAIAGILDTVDEAIRQTAAVIEKLKKIKAGLLHDLLTRGIDEDGQLRDPTRHPEQFKDSPLGKVPKTWEVKPLGKLCDLLNGLAFKPSDWKTTGLPIIRIQNLNGGQEFNYSNRRTDEKYLIPAGTLLFSWSGNRGTSFGPFIWPGPTGILNQHIFRVYPADGVRQLWFFYALDDVRQRVERAAHGAIGLVHVRRADLVKYLVAKPDPEEQVRIEGVMQRHDDRAQAEATSLRKLTLMKQGLMHDLLTGRVRVPMKANGKAGKT